MKEIFKWYVLNIYLVNELMYNMMNSYGHFSSLLHSKS